MKFGPCYVKLILGTACLVCFSWAAQAQAPPDTQPPVPPSSCVCGPQAACESAIVLSLEGEKAAVNLVANIPGPLPMPALLDISRNFRSIGRDVSELRSFQLYATLPVPLPLPARELLARSLLVVADLPLPFPYPTHGTMPAVANMPGPLPRPAGDTIRAAADLIATLPVPLPRPVRLALSRSLRDVATLPVPLPNPARDILLLSSNLILNGNDFLTPLDRQQLLALTIQLLRQNVLERLTQLEQTIGATPEAANLASLHQQLTDSVLAIPGMRHCDLCDAP